MHHYTFPHYGNQRGGTCRYEFGGHAYGCWSGLGDGGTSTPAAVAMVPEPKPLITPGEAAAMDRAAYVDTMQAQARQAQANAIAAAALTNPFAFAAQQAAATAMATKAAEVARGGSPSLRAGRPDELPPTASPRARQVRAEALARGGKPGGMGRGIPWEGKTPREKATTVAVGAGGIGAAWMFLL